MVQERRVCAWNVTIQCDTSSNRGNPLMLGETVGCPLNFMSKGPNSPDKEIHIHIHIQMNLSMPRVSEFY